MKLFKKIITSLLMAVSFVSIAAPRATVSQGNDTVILYNEQKHCEDGRLYAEYFDGTTTHKGCWALVRGGTLVHIKYDDGDEGGVPAQMFKPARTT